MKNTEKNGLPIKWETPKLVKLTRKAEGNSFYIIQAKLEGVETQLASDCIADIK